jgi:hypothetical protein
MRISSSYGTLLSCIALIFFTACATIPKLELTYKTPPKSTSLQGKEIYFNLIDKRSDKDIIGCKGDVYNVFWECPFMLSKAAKKEVVLGSYDIETLFNRTVLLYLEKWAFKLKKSPSSLDQAGLCKGLNIWSML